MNIATAITTAPRPGGALLSRCVRSMLDAGFQQPLIFAEPGVDVSDYENALQSESTLGAFKTWLRAANYMMRIDADAVLLAQDDIVFAHNAYDWCCGAAWPDPQCGLIQLCTSVHYKGYPSGLAKLHSSDAQRLAGAWACLFRKEALADLLDKPWTHDKHIDLYIGQYLTTSDWQVWVQRPSMALHSSEHSTMGHGSSEAGVRRTLDFAGS